MMAVRRVVAGLALLTALTGPVVAQDTTSVRTARITYLAGTSVYLDAGRLDGLREGARVDVVRSGTVLAVLKVEYLASHRSSCSIVSTSVAFALGDVVRFSPVTAPRDSSAAGAQTPRAAPAPAPVQARLGLRGRVGVDYFALWQRGTTSGSLSDPGLQLRLDGPPGGVTGLNLAIDVRARQTHTIAPDGSAATDGRNRVYQAALSWNQPGAAARVTVGRQLSPNLASVGLFDGVLAELNEPDWSTGVFTGTEPGPVDLAWSGSVMELGGYTQRHSQPGATTRWAVTLGASGSYQDAHANREFAFVQGSFSNTRIVTFLTQEVDYYPAWKQLPGMHTVSPTSTLAIARYRATAQVTLEAGFDNRRNVRLYRDVTNPAIAFDDAFRQGAWAGASFELTRQLRLGADVRSSSGGSVGHADAYTLSFSADRVTALGLSVRTRATRYTNPTLDGWLGAGALSVDPDGRTHVELNGGVRAEHNPLEDPASYSVTWVGADLDLTLARAWFLTLSGTRQRGGIDSYDEVFAGLSVRF